MFNIPVVLVRGTGAVGQGMEVVVAVEVPSWVVDLSQSLQDVGLDLKDPPIPCVSVHRVPCAFEYVDFEL